MPHPYEVVYIFDPALDEETIKQKLTHFQSLVQIPGNEPQFNHWGKRTLSYPIRRNDTGYYVVATFDAEPAALPEFERALKLDEAVIRHLIVLNDEPPTPAQAIPAKADYEEEE
ncbi:MAG TPA: 30S ribosomal protein S6 [Gemmatimonadales bacterium]|jgi:small subunit ribosomal protein S6|nr:30S ribosomal protein S6 [Gemmatimonadales bacterium]